MQRTSSRLLILFVALAAALNAYVPRHGQAQATSAPSLSAEQQALLPHLDDGTIRALLTSVERVEKLHSQVQAMKNGGAQVEADAPGPLIQLALEAAKSFANDAKSLQALGKSDNALVRKVHQGLKALQEIGANVDRQWREAPFNPEEFPFSTEEDFREELRELAYAQADAMIIELVDADLLAAVNALKDPAAFVKQFIEQQLTQYFDKPYPFAGLEFTLTREGLGGGRSLFAPDANIKVQIVYDSEISVQAEGLYFRYRQDGLPEPVLDKLRVDDSQLKQQFVGKTLSSLSDLFPAELGLPIKINNVESMGFQPGSNQKAGGVKFDIEVKFSDQLPAVKGDNVVIYPDGQIDFDKIGFENPTLIVPIPSTPFAFEGFAISYTQGKEGQASEIAGTTRITSAGMGKAYALELTMRVALPVKRVELEGNLIFLDGNISVAWVQTTLDFADGSLSGQYAIPGKTNGGANLLPIANVCSSEGSFRLDGNGLFAKGDYRIYGERLVDAELAILFSGGGYFSVRGGADVLGVRLNAQLDGGYEPGFSEFWLEAEFTATGISLRPWGEVSVNVEITVRNGELWVSAQSGVGSFTAKIPGNVLTGLTPTFLTKELERAATKMYHKMLDEMAELEEDGREWAAHQEAKAKKWLDEKLGFTGSTGIPELDNFGGRFSDGVKDAGGILSDWNKKFGGGVTDLREGVQGIGRDINQGIISIGSAFQ